MGVKFEGLSSREKIRERMEAIRSGQSIKVKVLRAGKLVELKTPFFESF